MKFLSAFLITIFLWGASKGAQTPLHSPLANASVLLHEPFFQEITEAVLPLIVQVAKNVTIPGQSEKHFSFDPIHLSQFALNNLAITFGAPNKVIVSLTGLTLAVPQTHFCVYAWIIFKISCCGYFEVNLADTTIVVEIEISELQGHLQIVAVQPSVTFGSLNVYHHFDSALCRVGQDIIQLFVGNIDTLIKNLVEKDIAPLIGTEITKVLNQMATKLPFLLAAPPVATSNSIQIVLDLLSFKAPRFPPALLRHSSRIFTQEKSLSSPLPNRDLEVWTNEASINTLVGILHSKGSLDFNLRLPPSVNTSMLKPFIPSAYQACPNCPLEIELNFLNAPSILFNGNATISWQQCIFGLNAVSAANSTVPLLDMYMNATGSAGNWSVVGNNSNTIKFQITVPTFSLTLDKSNIGPVDIALLDSVVSFLLDDVLVPIFNKDFKGITIPPLDGVSITDFAVTFNGGNAGFGLDIVIKPF